MECDEKVMPRSIKTATLFERDLKRIMKQGKDDEKLKDAILVIANVGTLPLKYKDHALTGKWKHHRECHIKPDWLLIYRLENERLCLVRTGSHAELFVK